MRRREGGGRGREEGGEEKERRDREGRRIEKGGDTSDFYKVEVLIKESGELTLI